MLLIYFIYEIFCSVIVQAVADFFVIVQLSQGECQCVFRMA